MVNGAEQRDYNLPPSPTPCGPLTPPAPPPGLTWWCRSPGGWTRPRWPPSAPPTRRSCSRPGSVSPTPCGPLPPCPTPGAHLMMSFARLMNASPLAAVCTADATLVFAPGFCLPHPLWPPPSLPHPRGSPDDVVRPAHERVPAGRRPHRRCDARVRARILPCQSRQHGADQLHQAASHRVRRRPPRHRPATRPAVHRASGPAVRRTTDMLTHAATCLTHRPTHY